MIIEDLIDRLMTRKALSVVVCFLLGVDTSLKDLKNGVFLKNTVLTYIHVFLLSCVFFVVKGALAVTIE